MVIRNDKQTKYDSSHELRNSNYRHKRIRVAHLISELMVVCPWTHDLGHSFWFFSILSHSRLYKCSKRTRKTKIMLILFIVYFAYGYSTLSIPIFVWSMKSSRVGPFQYLDGWLPSNKHCCKLYILFSRVSLFIEIWLSLTIKKWSTIYFMN